MLVVASTAIEAVQPELLEGLAAIALDGANAETQEALDRLTTACAAIYDTLGPIYEALGDIEPYVAPKVELDYAEEVTLEYARAHSWFRMEEFGKGAVETGVFTGAEYTALKHGFTRVQSRIVAFLAQGGETARWERKGNARGTRHNLFIEGELVPVPDTGEQPEKIG